MKEIKIGILRAIGFLIVYLIFKLISSAIILSGIVLGKEEIQIIAFAVCALICMFFFYKAFSK